MRLLVAPDSFKGTFDARTVAEAVAGGVEEAGGAADRCVVADGGEGTMEVLLEALGGERRTVEVHGPLRRPVAASFALLGDGETAVVEAAQASGLTLIAPSERDAVRADTYGTGELIAAAIAAGARKVLVAVGGSATTDGGMGAIAALREGDALDAATRIEVLCDVTRPFEQAAALFAPQKGAGAKEVEYLGERLESFAAQLPRDPRGVPMSGCAGGLSGGLWAHGARLRPGAAFVLEAIGFDDRLLAADAVVSGEGRLDSQSLEGKVVGEVGARCGRLGRPLHLVVGEDALAIEPPAAISSVSRARSLEEMRRAGFRLASSR
ncbi:MAG TPA: glycerate kinase [Solirubrobacterales bacterium]|nr:glycerate kinase [Solirubrobacterales bacterium]